MLRVTGILVFWGALSFATEIQWTAQFEKPHWYQVLGVSKDASKAQIEEAYRDLARTYHPDLNPNQTQLADSIFRQIKWAFHQGTTHTEETRPDFPKEVKERIERLGSVLSDAVNRDVHDALFGQMVSQGREKAGIKPKKAPAKTEKELALEEFRAKVAQAKSMKELEELTFKSTFNIYDTFDAVHRRALEILPTLKTPAEQAEGVVWLSEILEGTLHQHEIPGLLAALPDGAVKQHLAGIHHAVLEMRDEYNSKASRHKEAIFFYKLPALEVAFAEASRQGRELPSDWSRKRQKAEEKLVETFDDARSSFYVHGFKRLLEIIHRSPQIVSESVSDQVKGEQSRYRVSYPLSILRGKLTNLATLGSRVGLATGVAALDMGTVQVGIPTLIVGGMMLPGMIEDIRQIIHRPFNYRLNQGMIIDYGEPFAELAYMRRDEIIGNQTVDKAYLTGAGTVSCTRGSEALAIRRGNGVRR